MIDISTSIIHGLTDFAVICLAPLAIWIYYRWFFDYEAATAPVPFLSFRLPWVSDDE